MLSPNAVTVYHELSSIIVASLFFPCLMYYNYTPASFSYNISVTMAKHFISLSRIYCFLNQLVRRLGEVRLREVRLCSSCGRIYYGFQFAGFHSLKKGMTAITPLFVSPPMQVTLSYELLSFPYNSEAKTCWTAKRVYRIFEPPSAVTFICSVSECKRTIDDEKR